MHHCSKTRTARRPIVVLLLSAAALLIGGCGSAPPRPPIPFKAIALVPVLSPAKLYTDNRMVPLPVLPVLIASSIANRAKSAEFSRQMEKSRSEMGPQFTRMLLEELQARGFAVHVLEGIARPPTDPEGIDYATLPTQDAVLHVYFNDVSMESSRLSSSYLPRVNVDVVFLPRGDRPDDGTSLSYRYGADASDDGKSWSIPSDPKYRFPDFGALVSRAADVSESWQKAMRETARRIARDLPRPE